MAKGNDFPESRSGFAPGSERKVEADVVGVIRFHIRLG